MPTGTKVQFSLEVLKQKALESIDFRIAEKLLEVASYEDDDALAQRQRHWREAQEGKISDLFRSLGDVDDYRLSKFKVDPIPEVDRHERSRAERELRFLQTTRTQIQAKADSLVPDAEGNIALTSTQLADFFGL